MAELTHQMQLSPVRLRLKQFEAAEYLIDLLDPKKEYPYDFICHHLTGYRPKSNQPYKSMPGLSLTEGVGSPPGGGPRPSSYPESWAASRVT